jgi:hypothetical protein
MQAYYEDSKREESPMCLSNYHPTNSRISSVTTLPPVSVKPAAPTISVPEVAPDVDKEATPIASNVLSVSSRPDPDWITKAVAASRHEATLENQVVEARFVAMVVTGRPVIELLDEEDDGGLDVALGEAPGVTCGVTPGDTPGVDLVPFSVLYLMLNLLLLQHK